MKYPGIDKEFEVNAHPFWQIVESGQWELPVIEKLLEVVKSTDTIFDVGAWIGAYTLLLSYLAERVIAFEPYTPSRQILWNNLLLNRVNNVMVMPVALSDKSSVARLHFYNPAGIDDVLSSSMMNMVSRGSVAASVPVPTTTIDQFCETSGISPNGIKVDVEGYEDKVMKGCSRDCWKLIELHGKFADRPNVSGIFIDGDWNYGHIFIR